MSQCSIKSAARSGNSPLPKERRTPAALASRLAATPTKSSASVLPSTALSTLTAPPSASSVFAEVSRLGRHVSTLASELHAYAKMAG